MADAKEAIKSLIETNWSGSNEEQGKAVQLLKGLAFSDDDIANKFMKKVDDFMSSLKDEFVEGRSKSVKRYKSLFKESLSYQERKKIYSKLKTEYGVDAIEFYYYNSRDTSSPFYGALGFWKQRYTDNKNDAEDIQLEVNQYMFDLEATGVGAMRDGDIKELQEICDNVDEIVNKYL
jgi:hypothetical protein